jgi:hypothetical protein
MPLAPQMLDRLSGVGEHSPASQTRTQFCDRRYRFYLRKGLDVFMEAIRHPTLWTVVKALGGIGVAAFIATQVLFGELADGGTRGFSWPILRCEHLEVTGRRRLRKSFRTGSEGWAPPKNWRQVKISLWYLVDEAGLPKSGTDECEQKCRSQATFSKNPVPVGGETVECLSPILAVTSCM